MLGWLKTQVGDKPIWAILIAAMIAALGSAIVETAFGGISSLWRATVGQKQVRFLVRETETTRPLDGAVIRLLEFPTLRPVPLTSDGRTELITSNGMAAVTVAIPRNDYSLKVSYRHQGEIYGNLQPFKVDGPKLYTIDFTPNAWFVEGAAERPSGPVTGISEVLNDRGAPTWLSIAAREAGVSERGSPRVRSYLDSVPGTSGASPEQTDWSSAFANWVFEQAGILGTDSLQNQSWLEWGRPVTPQRGCLGVFIRNRMMPGGNTGTIGHVAFIVSTSNDSLTILGGNQRDSVSLMKMMRSRLVSCRAPASSATAANPSS